MAATNPVTLAQAKLHVQDKLTLGIIDEFRKSNWLLNNITFDQCATPTGQGQTFTYSYTRQTTQPTAEFRAINDEYVPQDIQRYSVDLKFFGGSFELDRQLSDIVGIESLLAHQIRQKIKATSALFNETAIMGNCSDVGNPDSFDGLDKFVTGTETEYIPDVIDLSSAEKIKENAFTLVYELNKFLKKLYFQPSFIGGNSEAIIALSSSAYQLGKCTMRVDEWGNEVEFFRGIPLIDFGAKMGSNDPVVPIDKDTGTTSIYVAYLGLDGFHAISKAGVMSPVVSIHSDFSMVRNVKSVQVEMGAAVVLKHSRAAGVMRNIKVNPTA